MRGCMLFVAGIVIGFAVQTPVAQNVGLVGLNHVAISVPNLDAALDTIVVLDRGGFALYFSRAPIPSKPVSMPGAMP